MIKYCGNVNAFLYENLSSFNLRHYLSCSSLEMAIQSPILLCNLPSHVHEKYRDCDLRMLGHAFFFYVVLYVACVSVS